MQVQHRTPFRTSFYLRLSEAVLATARAAVKLGWRLSTLLCGALELSNALWRAAMQRWRRGHPRMPREGSHKIGKRSTLE